MSFKEEQLARLAGIIAEYVPLAILLDLPSPDFALNLDSLRKQFVDDYAGLARKVVAVYDGKRKIPLLARGLYRRFHRDDLVATQFVEFCKDPSDVGVAYQAAFVLRANMLAGPKLRNFLAEIEPRICVVLAQAEDGPLGKGTGFLVGPDLIVTAYHTLKEHLNQDARGDLNSEVCLAVFDHLYGDPIGSLNPQDARLRRVEFAKDWLVKASEAHDFALVRLEEKIGLETYAGNGGRRRHWFKYDKTPIKPDERIIIPQHPDGASLQHDFGRFVEQAEIHIRYNTETFPGSSGAPCFDGEHRLVAMHNSVYQPDEIPVLNQAIRFDIIAPEINGHLEADEPGFGMTSELWSVTPEPQPPRPILGRKVLIDWIERAESLTIGADERVLIIESAVPRAGRGFTVEILHAARRESQDPVVVLGNERGADGTRQSLPQLADDALRHILQQLPFSTRYGSPQSASNTPNDPFPPRPSSKTSGETKLEKWAADDLPRKLNEILAFNRQRAFDVKSAASRSVEQARALIEDARIKSRLDKSAEAIAKQLEQVEKQLRSIEAVATKNVLQEEPQTRWERIWLAVILTPDTHVSKEVIELLSGLAKSTHPELMRLRFLFIGDVPQALKTLSSNKPELLDPATISSKDYSRCLQQIAISAGVVPSPEFIRGAEFGANGIITSSRTHHDRLAYLQKILADTLPTVREEIRGGG